MRQSWILAALLPLAVAADSVSHDADAYNSGSFGLFPTQKFHSTEILGPYLLENAHRDAKALDTEKYPHIFLATPCAEGTIGPVILSAVDLSLVYSNCTFRKAFHSTVQTLPDGSSALVFWAGIYNGTLRRIVGQEYLFDETYTLRYAVGAASLEAGTEPDMHDTQVTKDGTLIFPVYEILNWDTSGIQGGDETGRLMDSGFQEVDLETNEVLFDWRARSHFNLSASYHSYKPAGWDWAHVNSVKKTPNGNYLISMRQMSCISLINGTDGAVIWTIGGRLNEFEDLSSGSATNFSWQHDARLQATSDDATYAVLTLFDNHGEKTTTCAPNINCTSRGLELELNLQAKTARVKREYFSPEGVNVGSMGGFEALGNGNALIGWGDVPAVTEFSSDDGSVLLDFQLGPIGDNYKYKAHAYRVSRGKWVGKPTWPPDIAVIAADEGAKKSSGGEDLLATVYLSWNGATEVKTWGVVSNSLVAANSGGIPVNQRPWQAKTSNAKPETVQQDEIIATVPRSGFETNVTVGLATGPQQYIFGGAFDGDGEVLGLTSVVDVSTGKVAGGPPKIDKWGFPGKRGQFAV